ncbi:MAG: tRNA lysidine(34) synthetase TilS [Chlorobi bacterium]|nr:tRNA lysidine(34) synthetase TilS [Chlorobiota bacterium]
MKTTEQKIIRFVKSAALLEEGENVLIALSGGPDSVFALSFFVKFRRRFKINVFAAHVNHNLRGKDSDDDELFVKNLCGKMNIPLSVTGVDVKKFKAEEKFSTEEAARILRYEALHKSAENFGCSKIITAHTSGDNTETVLLNFTKGTGLSGAAGIPVKRGKIIRPLLSVEKSEILSYLKENEIPFRVDKTNEENDYQRNYIRNEIIPRLKKINPSLNETFFKSSNVFRNAKNIVDSVIEKNYEKYAAVKKGELKISTALAEKEGKEIFLETVKFAVERNFGIALQYAALINLFELISNQTGKSVKIEKSVVAVKERSGLVLFKNKKKKPFAQIELSLGDSVKVNGFEIKISKAEKFGGKFKPKKNGEIISADKIKGKFILRRWKKGDSFRPLGMRGTKNVSDFLTERKIDSAKRKEILVLTNDNKIVWIVGLRIDDRFKITEKTKKAIKLWTN